MKVLNRRYQLIGPDGEDHLGVYYIATDLVNQKEMVRIKLLNQDYHTIDLVNHYSDEFIKLVAIEHENIMPDFRFDIVSTVDNKPCEDKRYFYVTGYYEQKDLLIYHNLTDEERLFVLFEICYAIQFLHFRGLCYRYLTFDNVLITRDPDGFLKVRVRDLASLYGYLDQNNQQDEKKLVTIAPEILIREKGTRQSDLYSLGVMAYYLINGIDINQQSFQVTKHYSKITALQQLIESVTAYHGQERLLTMAVFMQQLVEIFPSNYPFKDKKSYERLNFNVPLVGRDKELDTVKLQIANRLETMTGTPGVLISGETGIGKSRFLRELHYTQRIIGVRAISIEIEKDYHGEHAVFSEVIQEIIKQCVIPKPLIEKYGPEFVKILPSLRELWGSQPSEPLYGEREILKLNNRIISFLLELAQSTKLFLALDNVDELNENEFGVLESIMALNENLPLFLAVSYNVLPHIKQQDLFHDTQFSAYSHINLENYAIDEAALHLQRVLCMDKPPLELAAKIVSEASGNPSYIEAVIKDLFMRNFIYIHESRFWFISGEGYDNIDIPQSVDQATLSSLSRFDEESMRIIEGIAVYGKPISKAMLLEMSHVVADDFDAKIGQLIELKILQIKFSDWGYTYDFYNRNLARRVYAKMSIKRKHQYHKVAAQRLEAIFLADGTYGETLVKHLIAAKNPLKAINYAIKLGDRMSSLSIFRQALDFYQQALNLLQELSEPLIKAQVTKAIADIYFRTGENRLAYDLYHQLVALADSENMLEVKVDAVLKLAEIMINRKHFDQIEGLFDEVRELANQIGYRIGLLELGLSETRYYMALMNTSAVEGIITRSLDLAQRIQNSYYIGRFLNIRGILEDILEQPDLAFKSFLSAAKYLEQTPGQTDLSRVYNNLGVIALSQMSDIGKARDYFEKALGILEKSNVIEGKSTYLMNIGETYQLEGDFECALRYIHDAERIAEDTTNIESLINVTMALIDCYISIKNYQEAYRYIQKFEKDYEPFAQASRDQGVNLFYFLCGVFYLRMRELMLAKAFLEKVAISEDFLPDNVSRYRYQLTRFVFDYIISEKRNHCVIDFDKIEALQKDAKTPIERAYLKDVLLDMALDIGGFDYTGHSAKLLSVFISLPTEVNTDSQRIKHSIALATLEKNDQAKRFEALIQQYENQLNSENKWLIHMMAGNAYYKEKDLFKALMHHLDALDIIHELTMSLPVTLRAGYILNDALRVRLYQRIQSIKVFMGPINPKTTLSEIDYSNLTLETYFDLGDMDLVFENEGFQRSIQEAYNQRYHLQLSRAEDLLKFFKRDQAYNLQLILRYLTQLTLAQSGFVYAFNDYGECDEVFKSEENSTPIDIGTFIKQNYDVEEGLLIEHKRRLYSDRMMTSRKSIICMPIFNAQDGDDPLMRRRYDEHDKGYHEVLGYLYLESDKLLNNINSTSFEAVKQMNNLLYVMLDNFKLKKAATMDKLTGVYLRKYIETEFNKELTESRNRNHELSVIMADIDHFKTVNDTFGHRKGDEVLFRIGEIMKGAVRHGDYVGRYGGEEFIVILPKTSSVDAYVVCEKIRQRVKSANLIGEDHPLTISLGLSTFPSMGQTDNELIERADQALYESKNMGRDRTTLYDNKIGSGNKRYDKLAGILSGNVSNDARVIKAMIDLVDLISEKRTPQEKIETALGIILDITEGQEAVLVVGQREKWSIFERRRGVEALFETTTLSESLIDDFFKNEQDDYFIYWDDIEEIDRVTGMPNWKSYIVSPLVKNGEELGMIVVRVLIKEKEFEFKHYNFVKHLTSVVASIL